MHVTTIIQEPVMTEKSYARLSRPVYTFRVHPQANKHQIKVAFSKIFNVQVARVRTINHRARPKRVGRFRGWTAVTKTAMIALKPGFRLDFLHEESQSAASRRPQAKPLTTQHGS